MVSEAVTDNDVLPSSASGKFRLPEDWPKWSRRFDLFQQASGLVKEEEKSQINTLIYAMADKADDILNSFKLSTPQLKQYHTVTRARQIQPKPTRGR